MNHNKICTNIEQSKHLLELGLNPETSDMFIENNIAYPKEEGYTDVEKITFSWSLSALLELMPSIKKIGYISNHPKLLRAYATDEWYMDCLQYTTDTFNTPIEAAYDMVVWLLGHGYIKTACEECGYNVTDCMKIECPNKLKKGE